MATRRDRTLVQRIKRAIEKSRSRTDQAAGEWSNELGEIFGEQVVDRDAAISKALDALELSPDGTIAPTPRNTEIVAQLEQDLGLVAAQTFASGGSFHKSTVSAGSKAQKEGIRRFGDTLAAVDRPLKPSELKLPAAARKRYREQLDQMIFTFYNAENVNVGKVRDLFLRHIADPTSTRAKLRSDLTAFGYGDAIKPMLDTLGRRITLSERCDRIAKYEFPRLMESSYQDSINEIYYEGDPPDVAEQFRMWLATIDGREQETHRARHGKVFSVKKWNEKQWGDGRVGLPPLRPRCRCDAPFVDPEWFSEETRRKFFNDEDETPIIVAPPEPVDSGAIRMPTPVEQPKQGSLWENKPSSAFPPAQNALGIANDAFDRYTQPNMFGEDIDRFIPKAYRGKRLGWTEERLALHREIRVSTFAGKEPVPIEDRVVTSTIGGPASGKSTIKKAAGLTEGNVVDLDADAMRKRTPDFKELAAAGDINAAPFSHEEASYLLKRAVDDAIEGGYNPLVDQVGGGDYADFAEKIAGYRKNGHRVIGHVASIDTEKALQLNLDRFERALAKGVDARLPPPEMAALRHKEVVVNMRRAMEDGLFDELTFWDNNASPPDPFVMATWKRGEGLVINDPAAWEKFLAKEFETIDEATLAKYRPKPKG